MALKLVEAMGGRDAIFDYLDLAAIATIADLVPLLDENRLIVPAGLTRHSRPAATKVCAIFWIRWGFPAASPAAI